MVPKTSPKNANLVYISKLANKKSTILLNKRTPTPKPKNNGTKNIKFFLKSFIIDIVGGFI